MNTFPLEEKCAIITGGLGGYGLAIADIILKRGGRVLLADVKPEPNLDLIKQHPRYRHFKHVNKIRLVLVLDCRDFYGLLRNYCNSINFECSWA